MTKTQVAISAMNLAAGWLSFRVLMYYLSWLRKDWRTLVSLSAGLLVVSVTMGLMRTSYEGFYYGLARILKDLGVADLWTGDPWEVLVFVMRVLFFAGVTTAAVAKYRADGLSWKRSSVGGALLATEGVAIFVLAYLGIVSLGVLA